MARGAFSLRELVRRANFENSARWCVVSELGAIRGWIGLVEVNDTGFFECEVAERMVFWRVCFAQSTMSSNKENMVTGAVGQGGSGGRVNRTELLNEKEFRDCFGIPNGVSIRLLESDAVSIAKSGTTPFASPRNSSIRDFAFRFLTFQAIPPLHPDSTGSDPPQHCPGTDGLQRPGHAV
ncbi:hypothetical protein CK203_030386 [Vitis vinifera]|uniref:Uncharacterized protein n=1 Tax=Vitis vinifera TaxID=29760 RepID=A0A438IVE2_VITVI|nr:hypothetical protein CK203_030386 [Vitis vinifera]